MAVEVSQIELLLEKASSVDCYTSTNVEEVCDIIVPLGYVEQAGTRSLDMRLQQFSIGDPYAISLKHNKLPVELDCTDIDLDLALGIRKELGFSPQSKFRIYFNMSNPTHEVVKIFRALADEHQHMGFFNETGGKKYVHLSAADTLLVKGYDEQDLLR